MAWLSNLWVALHAEHSPVVFEFGQETTQKGGQSGEHVGLVAPNGGPVILVDGGTVCLDEPAKSAFGAEEQRFLCAIR